MKATALSTWAIFVTSALAYASCGPSMWDPTKGPNQCRSADEVRDYDASISPWHNWGWSGITVEYNKKTKTIRFQCMNEMGCDKIAFELDTWDPVLTDGKLPIDKDPLQDRYYQVVDLGGYQNACTVVGWYIGYRRLYNCN